MVLIRNFSFSYNILWATNASSLDKPKLLLPVNALPNNKYLDLS